MESHIRSLAKALIWRFFGAIATFSVAWLVTGELTLATGIGIADTVLKLGAYYLHERLWDRLEFGKLKRPEYEI